MNTEHNRVKCLHAGAGAWLIAVAVLAFGDAAGCRAADTYGGASAGKAAAFLRVQRLMTRTGGNTVWWTTWGSELRDYNRVVVIEIEVRNMQTYGDQFEVEWYFVGKALQSGKLWLFDKGKRSLRLAAGQSLKGQTASKPLAAAQRDTVWYGHQAVGSKIEGYVVLVRGRVGILACESSAPHLGQLAKSRALSYSLSPTEPR